MKILIFISLVLIPSFSSAQNVSGIVQDFHFNTPLEVVSVTLKNNSNGEILGTDSTDASGNYSIDYAIVSVNENSSVPDDYHLSNAYPNPFNPSAKIDFSTPHQGKFTVRIFNVIGQLVYSKDFIINAGNHSFNISGLGSAGVYLFNLSSDDFSATQKLLQLDGGNAYTNVSLIASNHSRLKKSAIDELLIEFRKDWYFDKDTVINWQMNLAVDAEIKQVPKQDTVWIYSNLNLVPTNTAADGATISANGSIIGTTNSQGLDTGFVLVQYVTNPLDSTDKKYSPAMITLLATRVNAQNVTDNFLVDGSDIEWSADMQQVPFLKTYNYSIFVPDSSTGQGVSGANVTGKKTSNDSLMVFRVTDSQGLVVGFGNYLGFENDPSGLFNFVSNMTWTATKNMFNSNSIVVPFSSNIADTVVISPVPPPVRSWEWRVMDPLDNALSPTIFVKNQEGEVFTFNPQTNGVYQISVPTFGNSVKVWWSHSDLQEIGYIMPPNKQGQDRNIAQNEGIVGLLDTLTVSDVGLLENFDYTKLKLLHNFVDGRDMKSFEVRRIIGGRGGGYTSRFMAEPSLNLPRLDIVIYGKYENGTLLSAFDSTKIVNITTNVAGLIKSLDYQIHYILDWSEQIWQDILARDGDNAVMYRFRQLNPGNIIDYKFASNGLIRNKYGSGWGNVGNGEVTWAAEIMQPMFSLNDPDVVQGLGPWIYINGVGPTQFARYIAAYISEADNQRYLRDPNEKPVEKESIQVPFTSTPTWGNVNYHYKED